MIEITDFSSHIYNNLARKKKCKTLVGGARGCFFCLTLVRTFAPLTRRLSRSR